MEEFNDTRRSEKPVKAYCNFCGAMQWFGDVLIRRILITPPCPRCGKKEWLDVYLDMEITFGA